MQRDEPRGSKNASLSHTAAQRLAMNSRLFDRLFAPEKHRPNRSAQPLRQAKHHGIEATSQLRHTDAERRCCVEDPRHVKMYGQTSLPSTSPNLFEHR